MVGKAVIRAFLILALIVTAHVIKPFSIKSVTQHVLYSTRSFKFVLPAQLRDNFDHANYLAINLSNSLFEAGKGIQNFTKDAASDLGLVAIKVQPLDEVNKSATKPKSGVKKSAPAKRVIKTERSDATDLIASMNSDEIMPVELPPAPEIEATRILAPVVQPCVTKLFPASQRALMIAAVQTRPSEILVALRKSDCEKREAAQGVLIVLIQEAMGLKAIFRDPRKSKVERNGLIASECEERKTEVVAEDLEIEIAEPEEEIVAPQTNEEFRLSPLSTPFERCSKEL
ncbi:MAG: hypothetical protein AB7U82_10570 [Blastocatellales bacterium]